jgi:anti-sigma-K factor RskA
MTMKDQQQLLNRLADRATEGLSDEESRILEEALRSFPDLDGDEMDLTAAAVDRAFDADAVQTEVMPEHLKRRILQQARESIPSQKVGAVPPSTKPGLFSTSYLGWYAAAAMLLIALWSPWAPTTEPAKQTLTVAEQRVLLMETAADTIQVAWATPEIAEYAQVKGDVVWSNEQQAGFMRLRGLPSNRSEAAQYQFWIVDPTRDERPIDGGVFDIPAGVEEVIVPIDAKLRSTDPKVFAITLEQPGGVVVSDGPLLVVAAVEA